MCLAAFSAGVGRLRLCALESNLLMCVAAFLLVFCVYASLRLKVGMLRSAVFYSGVRVLTNVSLSPHFASRYIFGCFNTLVCLDCDI
jgi:hypothetical protein